MKPEQRLLQAMAGALVTIAALSACRREVPPPPVPLPEKHPKPTVQLSSSIVPATPAARWRGA